MPKLKKFRVVNLVYNETRHIYDETFDFNDGKHTMMLLANGGGKTVLTQMMLQPVIPKTDLKTRKFIDYFKHNKRPTLLMSEWLLDDGSSSLLTGLVIMNKIRKKRGTEDQQDNLEIFAFTIHYHYNDIYKIDTVPVTFRDDSGRKTMYDFDTIVSDLKKHEQKFKQYVSVFNWSDSREAKDQYGKKLAEHGIIQQEWKDNILKINKEEAGLKSFFEDAKTATTLLKRKILPTIESKLDENAKDKVELQSVFKKHAIELVNNKKIINNEKLYKAFLNESQRFEEKAYKLNNAKNSYLESVTEVKKFHLELGDLHSEVNQKISNTEEDKLNNRRMMAQIGFEEECFKYYKKYLDFEYLLKDLEELREKLNQQLLDYNGIEYKDRKLSGIKIYYELSEVQRQLSIKRGEYERLINSDKSLDYQQLKEVLFLKFNDRQGEITEALNVCHQGIETLHIKMNEHNDVINDFNKEKRKQEDTLAIYKNKTKEFESVILGYNDTNKTFQWNKHPLYDDYEITELTDYIKQLITESDSILKDISESVSLSLTKKETIQLTNKEIQNLRIKESEEAQKLKQYKVELNSYLEKESEVYNQLKVMQIDKKELFDNDYVLNQIDGVISGKEERYNHLTIEKALTEQLSESLREGKLISLPEPLVEFLEDHNIIFEYGYDWLKSYEGDYIPQSLYMEQLNVLPYALVMDESNYEHFQHLVKSYRMNMLLPIVNETLIHRLLKSGSYETSVPGLVLHTAFEESLLDQNYVSQQIDCLTEKLSGFKDEQELLLKSRNHYFSIRNNYLAFISSYDEKSNVLLGRKVIDSEDLIATNIKEMKDKEQTIVNLNEEIDRIKVHIEIQEKSANRLNEKLNRYNQLSEKYFQYCEDKKTSASARSRVSELVKLIKIKEDELGQNQENMGQVQERFKALTLENQGIVKELLVLGELEVQDHIRQLDLFKESMDELLTKQEVYKRELGDIRDIEEFINIYSQQQIAFTKKLMVLELVEDDYINKEYDEVLHQEVLTKKRFLQQMIEQLKNEFIKKEGVLETKKETLDSEKEEILSKPNRKELINSEHIIYTDFRQRKADNQQEYHHIDEKLKDLERLLSEIELSYGETMLASDHSIEMEKSNYFDFERRITPVEVSTKRQHLLKEMQYTLRHSEEMKQELIGAYIQLKAEFYGKNDLLNNMFDHLLKDTSLDDFDFIKRVLKQSTESIERKLDKYNADIKALKDKEANLFSLVTKKVFDVYDELFEIDRHSIIDLNEKRQKMLYIQLPKKETLDTSRLIAYLQDIIRMAKNKYEKQDINDLDKYLDSHLKLEQLFDEYVPIGSISVNISKIEQNKVTKMTWEEVGNASGGELFVSVFIVFSSLLSYTRGYQLSRKQQGNVLVMDNPFGPVSSEHLLEPLFKIAETYDTQMICFTHINTSGITSQFDLIYSLRVVQEGGSGREHVEVELAKDKAKNIERLDSGKFEIGSGDQIGFLV